MSFVIIKDKKIIGEIYFRDNKNNIKTVDLKFLNVLQSYIKNGIPILAASDFYNNKIVDSFKVVKKIDDMSISNLEEILFHIGYTLEQIK